ncbi:MAG: hypothetical protein IPH46_17295 [Bacteroidetes bacterium]|nr:hypothetical protein [Bacteroidota bacterium]
MSCSSQKISFDSEQNISNLIVCEYLREIEGIKSNDQSVYIYKGLQKEKNDHTFCRKYIDNSVKDDTTEFINWVDKNLSSLCEISQNIFISEQDFHFKNFNKKHAVFRISDIYFCQKRQAVLLHQEFVEKTVKKLKSIHLNVLMEKVVVLNWLLTILLIKFILRHYYESVNIFFEK